MKIAVVWWWEKASETFPLWRDGLRAALEIIAEHHEVVWFMDKKEPPDEFDAILVWGDSNCEFLNRIYSYRGKKGIFLTTNPHNREMLLYLNAVYCESEPVYKEARSLGLRAVKAFGTDEQFFKPTRTTKDIEYLYPATFSPWKRQSSIVKLGKKLTCIGTLQPDGKRELEACEDHGVNVKLGYFPAEELLSLYKRAKNVIIPAVHGSERTVLEAMSMNMLPIVDEVNQKATSYIKEYNDSVYESPREFVKNHYAAWIYAKNIMKGLS